MVTQGKVIQVLPIQEGVSQSGKAWAIQGFVIETGGQYPKKQYIEIFGKDKIQQNLPQVGDDVTAFVDIESREYNGKWYTSVRAWKVTRGVVAVPDAQPMPSSTTVPQAPADGQNSNLPF